MNNPVPRLIVIAGCNGSGKSTYSRSLTPDFVDPFDYDSHFLKLYHSMPDSEFREKMAHNMAFEQLKRSIGTAISNKLDFCYETNFNSTPMHWPELFRKNGYRTDIFFFCLNTVSEAKRRVLIRFQNGGHFVPDHEVEERYRLGYAHLNKHFRDFSQVYLFDTSKYDSPPAHVLSASSGKLDILSHYPEYLEKLLPNITKLVVDYKQL